MLVCKEMLHMLCFKNCHADNYWDGLIPAHDQVISDYFFKRQFTASAEPRKCSTKCIDKLRNIRK